VINRLGYQVSELAKMNAASIRKIFRDHYPKKALEVFSDTNSVVDNDGNIKLAPGKGKSGIGY